jgi:hypothetical protein
MRVGDEFRRWGDPANSDSATGRNISHIPSGYVLVSQTVTLAGDGPTAPSIRRNKASSAAFGG